MVLGIQNVKRVTINLPHSSFVRDFINDLPVSLRYMSEDEGPGSVMGSYCGILCNSYEGDVRKPR